jgi:hypothetical protein
MPFRKTIAVYSENHVRNTNSLHGQNSDFLVLKQAVYTVTTVF